MLKPIRTPKTGKDTPPKKQTPYKRFARVTESSVQKSIVRLLIMKKWLVVRMNSGGMKTQTGFVTFYRIENTGKCSGLPDLIAFRGNEYLFIEVKGEGGKLRESQKQFAEYCKLVNATVHVFDSWEAAKVFIDGLG